MSKFKLLVAASCLAFAGAAAHAGTIVSNGSFEDPLNGDLNNRGWNFFDSVPHWDGDPNVEIQTQPTLGLTPADGANYVELDTNQNTKISQTINFDHAGDYVLSFYYSPRVPEAYASGSTNDMGFSIVGSGSNSGVWDPLNGMIQGAPDETYKVGEWTQVLSTFSIVDTGSYVLSFFGAGLDNEGSSVNRCGDCGAVAAWPPLATRGPGHPGSGGAGRGCS